MDAVSNILLLCGKKENRMKLASACFQFNGPSADPIMVWFHADDKGQPDECSVVIADKTFRVGNKTGKYRPCMTHAKELIELKLMKPPKSNFAAKRRKETKPLLRIAE